MSRPTITVLSPTLSGNAVFRTHALIRLLKKQFTIQLIAFESSSRVFAPLEHDPVLQGAIRYHAHNVAGWRMRLRGLAKNVSGDVIFCVKPFLSSFGAGLLLGKWLRKPVIVDIDDWERGFLASSPYWEARMWGPRWLTSPDSPFFTRLLDGFTHRAAAITVSNSFLQGLYGGHWIPHARDASAYVGGSSHPSNAKSIVLFAGSPRGHKGLATLLGAWKRLNRPNAVLRLVVPDPRDPFLTELKPFDAGNVEIDGPYPFDALPNVLHSADIIVVPQDNRPGALGQLPAKLIDAMAAGKPIVASDVCDAARWLDDGAGVTVTPGSERALATALATLLDQPALWGEMGARARARFMEFASEAVLERKLSDIVAGVASGTPMPIEPAFSPSLSSSAA